MPVISLSPTTVYATINKSTNAPVAAGDPILWDPAGATINIISAGVAAWGGTGNDSLVLTRGGVFDIHYLAFPGNPLMPFAVELDGVEVPPTGDAGSLYMARIVVPPAGGAIRILNKNTVSETPTGVAGDAVFSIGLV